MNNQQFYKKVNEDRTEGINKRVRFYLKRLLSEGIIDKETHNYLTPQDRKAGHFYILPKIHKAGNPGRPIVSANGHPTEKISEFVSFHLNPLVQSFPSYVKNTTHLLNKLKDIDALPSNAILVTLDVSSLYTNIPTNEGINACNIALGQRTDKSVPTESRMILTMNNFVFNDEHFIQQNGTAMGTRMAPAYTNLFMGEFERKALKAYADQPFLWLQYIDDILMVWTHGEEKLDNFITYLNNIHPTIKFTSERSTTSIPFLDVNIQLENGKIETDLYCKPTDKHQYLLHSSSHRYHTKKAIPYSLALRLRRICSKGEFFEHRSAELLSYLTKRGYKDRFVKEKILRAKQIPRSETLQEHNHDKDKSNTPVPFTITYNPALPNIQEIIHRKQPILNSTDRLQKIFKDKPFIAYRRSPNLRDLLVRAKLKNTNTTPKLTSGTFRCNSTHGCLTCPYIDDARTSYTFSNTGETRQIKRHITCNSTNLTYMIECKKCKKQYIGETKRTIRERFTEHRQATNNPHHANSTAAVPTHFNLPGHSSADMRLIPLELQPTINASRRKARETFLIHRGKTLSPEGINRKNER